MKAAALLVLVALAQDPLPRDPIRDWKYTRKDLRHDVRTGKDIEEITLILAGDEAVPVQIEKKIFDLRGVKARYFTDPAPDQKSEEIEVAADRGHYDHEARILKLDDRVRVVKRNGGANRNDTVLTASHALLRFNRMYECPTCRKRPGAPPPVKAPGRCAIHDEALKEATVTSVEVTGEFRLDGPEGILSGEGLVTDDAILREYHITRNGFVEFGGGSSALAGGKKAPASPEAKYSQIFSRGPLQISGPELDRTIVGREGMRIDRIDSTGTVTLRARTMEIRAIRPIDAETGKPGAPEILEVDARGSVILEGVVFEDSSSFQTRSESLNRTLADGKEIIRLKSTGEIPVHVESGRDTIESQSVTITRLAGQAGGVSVFENVLNSKLRAGDQDFALRCDTLTTYAEPNLTGRTDLRRIEATGRVGLGGLLSGPDSKGPPGEAQADTFEWDVPTRRGWMTGTPFVRITQGPSTIVAPKVVMESPSIIVLKGPKQVHLVQDREGVKEEYRATCEGDLVLDQAAHRLTMRGKCAIRTTKMVLHSERVNAILTEDGKGLESLLATGRVHAVRRGENGKPTDLYGDRLAFRFKDQDLRVYGEPYAVAETGSTLARQEQIRVYEKKHPKTGQMILYTEMIGGRDGVRIEIVEKTGK